LLDTYSMGRMGSTTSPFLKTFGACVALCRAYEECLTSLSGLTPRQHDKEESLTTHSLGSIETAKSNALYSVNK
jgi:hypothetical protein